MKRILAILWVIILLASCQKSSNITSTSAISSDFLTTSSFYSNNISSSNSSDSSNSSNNNPSSSLTNIDRPDKNPDGSSTLPIANDLNNRLDITDYTFFDFKSSLPTNFKYIYGNNITNAAFYADENGGLRMNENSGPKKGFQTAAFNSWQKIEVRIHIGLFYNASHTVNTTNPVFTIYGFDANGLIVSTATITNIEKTSEKNFVRVYLLNTKICYLEVRATNLPYKSSQVYNFGVTGLTLKGWPFA